MARGIVFAALGAIILVFAQGACAGLADGLIAYYPFNGTVQDASGEGNNGEAHGATFITDRHGTANAACTFNGTGDYIWIGDCVRPDSLSVSLWFKTTSTRTGISNAPVILRDRWCGHVVIINPNNQIGCLQADIWTVPAVKHSYVSTENTCNDGKWHHVAYTWDQSVFRAYLDGKERYSDRGKSGGPLYCLNGSDGGGMAIGRDGNADSGYFDGCIDDVCIYDRALAADEVAALHADRTNLAAAVAAATTPSDPLAVEFPYADRIAVLPLDAGATKKVVAALGIEKKGTQEFFVIEIAAKGFKAEPLTLRKPVITQGNARYQYAYVSSDAISLTNYLAAAEIAGSHAPYSMQFNYYRQPRQAVYNYSTVRRMDEGTNTWMYYGRGELKKASRQVRPATIDCGTKPALTFVAKANSRLKVVATVGCSITTMNNGAQPVPTVDVKDARGVAITNELKTSFG